MQESDLTNFPSLVQQKYSNSIQERFWYYSKIFSAYVNVFYPGWTLHLSIIVSSNFKNILMDNKNYVNPSATAK